MRQAPTLAVLSGAQLVDLERRWFGVVFHVAKRAVGSVTDCVRDLLFPCGSYVCRMYKVIFQLRVVRGCGVWLCGAVPA